MRLFIYTSSKKARFKGLFYPIGGYKKVILSNNDNEIKRFNQKGDPTIELLLSEVKVTKNVQDDTQDIHSEDKTIYFIPLEMKDTFLDLLKKLFKKTKWVEDKTTQKPSTADIGLVGGDPLSESYETMEVQEVLKPATQGCISKKLENLLNEIAATPNNQIDGIFLFDLEKEELICRNTNRTLLDNLDSVAESLGMLGSINDMLNHFGKVAKRGELKCGTFQFSDGILNLYFFEVVKWPLVVGFVSATAEGLGRFLAFSKTNVNAIKNYVEKQDVF